MQDECELRLDIPLPPDGTTKHFEQGWRAQLSAQRLTALAVPPAQALAVRFRVCGLADEALRQYLPHRLHALPGAPRVQAEADDSTQSDWRGVRIWLSYRVQDLPALLQRPPRKPAFPSFPAFRGRRSS
jgi:hypothetical protein